jgi:hypothetical protein
METYGIIAASPIIPKSEHTLPHRVVIRDLGHEYVVHTQIWEDGKTYFHQGHYFAKSTAPASVAQPDNVALGKAWAAFERRSRRTLGLEEVGVLTT